MATAGKATKKEKRKPVPVKTSLSNPYDLKWKPLEKGHARFILKTVTDKISSIDLRKLNVKVFRKWGNKKKAMKGNSDSVDIAESTQELQNRGSSDSVDSAEPAQELQRRGCLELVNKAEPAHESQNRGCLESVNTAEPAQESQNRGWTDKRLRNELAIGINEVTKALERNELGLVLVCDSVKPAHMTSHLISLSQTRSVPACQVPGLSANLAGSLGLTSVLALGFKRQSGAFADTISALVPKVPPLDVAWLPTGKGLFAPAVVQVSSETDQHKCEDEEAERGRKRKREDSPKVKKGLAPSLQPLKVKKIVPNPSKVRKPKIKKSKK